MLQMRTGLASVSWAAATHPAESAAWRDGRGHDMEADNEEFEISADPYGEEILNANWMPRPEVPLGAVRSAAADEDPSACRGSRCGRLPDRYLSQSGMIVALPARSERACGRRERSLAVKCGMWRPSASTLNSSPISCGVVRRCAARAARM